MALPDLTSNELATTVEFVSTPRSWINLLRRNPIVQSVLHALRDGAITEDDIARFTRSTFTSFSTGQKFCGEPALSALAVILSDRSTKFAERYLKDLSALRIAEMPMSPRVAELLRVERAQRVTHNQIREFPGVFELPEVQNSSVASTSSPRNVETITLKVMGTATEAA